MIAAAITARFAPVWSGAAAAASVVGFGWEVLPAVRPAGRAPAGQTLVAVKVRLDD